MRGEDRGDLRALDHGEMQHAGVLEAGKRVALPEDGLEERKVGELVEALLAGLVQALRMAETIEQVQAEVRQNFVALEAEIRSVRDPAQRAAFLRDLAGLKAEAVPMLRDDLGLQGYRTETAHPDYRGLPEVAADARAVAIKVEADGQVSLSMAA
jgi:hypothetical protein